MRTAVIALGTNEEPRLDFLHRAIKEIEKIGEVIRVSSAYENEADGFDSDTLFYNAVLLLQVDIPAVILLNQLKDIEKSIGRKPNETGKPTSRCIDLDIIAFDHQVIISEKLVVPHPRFRERNFVLTPLVEIYPDWRDPITQLSARELLLQLGHAEKMEATNLIKV